jgi:hypothetical protein
MLSEGVAAELKAPVMQIENQRRVWCVRCLV